MNVDFCFINADQDTCINDSVSTCHLWSRLLSGNILQQCICTIKTGNMKKYSFLGVTTILNNNAVVPIDKTQVFSTVDSIRKCFVLEHSYLQLSPNQSVVICVYDYLGVVSSLQCQISIHFGCFASSKIIPDANCCTFSAALASSVHIQCRCILKL